MSRREGLALGLVVLARALLLLVRVLGDPMRTWNLEESYNATEAWLLGHGALWGSLDDLQYRSFCGGCTVVSVLGAPILGLFDRFVAWKALAVTWGAATHLLGFAAVDRHVGRAGAWVWALLWMLPPPGMADLSLMLWGNHVESGLFLVAGLALLPRSGGLSRPSGGSAVALGFVLGIAVFFARTSLYQWALMPFALARLPRLPLLVGLGLGLLPLAWPTAAGDGGFYDLLRSVGASPPEALSRLGTLVMAGALADRLFHPLPRWAPVGALWLLAAGAGAALVRGPVLATAAAWIVAYCFTTFPIFLVTPRVPVNNLRYHAPWALLLTLLVAAGAGAMWKGARGRLAGVLVVGALLGSAGFAWRETVGRPDLAVLELRASHPITLAMTATGRLDEATLTEEMSGAGEGEVRRLLGHMLGLRAGFAAREGGKDEALAGLPPEAWLGFGEALATPCDDPMAIDAWLTTLPAETAARVGRGAGLTLGFCQAREGEGKRRKNRQAPPGLDVFALLGRPTRLASAAGGFFLMVCERQTGGEPAEIGACLAERAAGIDDVVWGAGVAYGHPMRPPAQREAIAAALGEQRDAFLEGTREAAAGVSSAYVGR